METPSFTDPTGYLFSGVVVNSEGQREGRILVSHLGQGVSLDPSCSSVRRAGIFSWKMHRHGKGGQCSLPGGVGWRAFVMSVVSDLV